MKMKGQRVNLQIHKHGLEVLQQFSDLDQPLPILICLDTRNITEPATLGAEPAVAEGARNLFVDPVLKFPCSIDESLQVLSQLHRKMAVWETPITARTQSLHYSLLVSVRCLWNVQTLLSLSLAFD